MSGDLLSVSGVMLLSAAVVAIVTVAPPSHFNYIAHEESGRGASGWSLPGRRSEGISVR